MEESKIIIITQNYSYIMFYIMYSTHMNLINILIFTVKSFANKYYHEKLVTLSLYDYDCFLPKIIVLLR